MEPSRVLDHRGRPIERRQLTEEIAAPTLTGVRSPLSGNPGDGLNPVRLANIMREADRGEPVRYMELAEVVEERDPHYLSVISTRKRSVSQIEITVDPGGEDAHDLEMAEMVRDWLKRDELASELFDILDCIGKGYSFTEIIWDSSEGQWRPERLEWRDPRWFRFERRDLATPLMLDEHGRELPLPAFKFIFPALKAKSGLPLRGGLSRVAAWGWMFKAYTARDWAIFTQTYGQPLRLGKYQAGSSEEDKSTLFRAVANIAGDCAAIIPESMSIDFVETQNVGASIDLYERRSDWLDRQISKAVLGQTTTTDAVSGGHAVSQEHRLVQEDIERADAIALAGVLNRDLIRPWIDLEYGPQARYPRVRIAREEPEDVQALSTALAALVPLGLKVRAAEVRTRLALSEPGEGDEVLGAAPVADAPPVEAAPPALQAEGDIRPAREHIAGLAERLEAELQPEVRDLLERIETMLSKAGSLEEFREMLLAGFPDLDTSELTRALAGGLIAAEAAGRLALEDESG
ncbi:DUF935 domain-containing protein [Maritimibacter sp. 55A14]|uniref:DUF935 domain-containing protein n=1 Tax=Maritimibacter sp. 55A14 TaxID=2174844 RepID=UPI000D617B03|nr:DUF935 domain-containing protein [Maritimibacter sp. 55A14]PWE29974.1 DUF935 domain-containing protein [Maritimibacter sp. 55A14]